MFRGRALVGITISRILHCIDPEAHPFLQELPDVGTTPTNLIRVTVEIDNGGGRVGGGGGRWGHVQGDGVGLIVCIAKNADQLAMSAAAVPTQHRKHISARTGLGETFRGDGVL